MNKYKNTDKQAGFTIVELMIATVVFSMVLLVCAYAIIHVGRMYYKGMIMSRTQDVSKRIVDDVVDTIKFSGAKGQMTEEEGCYQIGNTVYAFADNNTVKNDANSSVLTKGTGTCDSIDSESVELMGRSMRLAKFSITPPEPESGGVWQVNVTVSYGENGDFEEDSDFTICKGVNTGGQFCAVSKYSTQVVDRL